MENIDCFDMEIPEAEFNLPELDFGFETEQERYINPGRKKICSQPVKYRHAVSLAKKIGDIGPDDRYFVFLDGNFVFGDFIEAWVIENQWNVLEMTISTLSLSQNNVDSLVNLYVGDYLQKLNIIVSDYFFSHERRYLIPYMYKELDIDNKFQLAVSRVHTKICLIETECGKKIIIHGSANLRTSQNVEQIVIERDPELFEFNESWHKEIIEAYKTINKKVEGKGSWEAADQKSGKTIIYNTGTQDSQSGRKKTMKQTLGQPRPAQDETESQKEEKFHSKAW